MDYWAPQPHSPTAPQAAVREPGTAGKDVALHSYLASRAGDVRMTVLLRITDCSTPVPRAYRVS